MCFFCERYWWTKGNFLLYNFRLHNYYFAVKIIQLPCYPTAFVLQVNNITVNVFPITFPGHSAHMLNSSKDLPKIVIANFSQGSAVKSMDFHPGKQSLLLGLLMLLNKFVFFGFFCFLFLVKFTCCMVSGILFYFLPISVGTSIGDITVWEVGSKHRLLSRSFKIWDLAACSATLQV